MTVPQTAYLTALVGEDWCQCRKCHSVPYNYTNIVRIYTESTDCVFRTVLNSRKKAAGAAGAGIAIFVMNSSKFEFPVYVQRREYYVHGQTVLNLVLETKTTFSDLPSTSLNVQNNLAHSCAVIISRFEIIEMLCFGKLCFVHMTFSAKSLELEFDGKIAIPAPAAPTAFFLLLRTVRKTRSVVSV